MKACINYEICKCRPDLKAFCDKVKDAMEESWNMGAKVSPNSISTAQYVLGEAMQPIIAELDTLKERCICAAIKTTCGQVIRGHRHRDCISIIQVMGIGSVGSEKGVQGFVTSKGRFVDRFEGYQLQIAAGIESIAKGGYRADRLFSEDIY